MQKNKLLLYGTVFNAEKYLPAVMQSLEYLKPLEYELFVVDNYSKDMTYEILKSYNFVHIIQSKCSRGKGRNLALGMLLELTSENLPVKYMDFDNVFTPQQAKIIKRDIKRLIDNIIYPSGISIRNTNQYLEWKDLNAGEDWERMARAKSMGIKVIPDNDIFRNPERYAKPIEVANEHRYARGLSYYIRKFNYEVDNIRGRGGSKYSYLKYIKGGFLRRLAFEIAYPIAKLKGIYRYSEKDNEQYVRGY